MTDRGILAVLFLAMGFGCLAFGWDGAMLVFAAASICYAIISV